jgi:sugar phosphate isomerase/epimerase
MSSAMKFAICNETFQDWPHDKAFAMAAECGYTGIEIAPFTLAGLATDVTAAQRGEIRALAKKTGLEVVGLHWLLAKTQGFHVTSPDATVRSKTSAYMADLVRLCADLGGKVLVFGSPLQRNLAPGMTLRQGIDLAVQVIEPVVPLLEQTGAVLALEPLGPQETNFLMTGGETTLLIERLASKHVQLHLDCKAMATESLAIPDLIRRHCDVLAHFHVNDPNRQGPGFGSLDFHPILQALGEVDYRGWVSVEVFDYTPGIERLARESLAYMQRCLADLAKGA